MIVERELIYIVIITIGFGLILYTYLKWGKIWVK